MHHQVGEVAVVGEETVIEAVSRRLTGYTQGAADRAVTSYNGVSTNVASPYW